MRFKGVDELDVGKLDELNVGKLDVLDVEVGVDGAAPFFAKTNLFFRASLKSASSGRQRSWSFSSSQSR